MRPKAAHQPIASKVAREVTRMVNATDKTQYTIAEEIGVTKSNFITMLKQGRTKVPLDKVVPLAKACNADPAKFMLLVLEEYRPEIIEALGESFQTTVTDAEAALMRSMRHAKRVHAQERKAGASTTAGARKRKRASDASSGYRTSPESLKKLYDFTLRHMLD